MKNIEIITTRGEKYTYDPDTQRIFKDGVAISSIQCEPVFSFMGNVNEPPKFSGILLKDINSILTLSGKINPVISDLNSVK